MSRSLRSYVQTDEFGALEVQDPAFLDTAILRIVQDAELVAYTIARNDGRETLDEDAVARSVDVIGATELLGERSDLPDAVIDDFARTWVVPYKRSPIPVTDGAVYRLATLTASASYRLLRAGAHLAVEEGSTELLTQHLLPFCTELPYPLNHWLC